MPATPQVSVVIAAYNWSSVLRYSIASVLRQTLDDFELWVIGDACTDDSEQVARSFGDARLHWHNLERNSGSQAGPNNAGVARARADFVAYLGQDDLWHPEHLASTLAVARATGADAVHGLAEVIYPGGERTISGLTPGGELTADDVVVTSCLLHRRSLFDEVGPWAMPEEVALQVDVEWQRRLWLAGKTFRGTGRLSAFKFPAAARPASYLERPSHEQAEYARRMFEEPDFIERELLAVARSALLRPLRRVRVSAMPAVGPGAIHRLNRQMRGLDAHAAMAPLPPGPRLPLRIRSAPGRVVTSTRFVVAVELENDAAGELRTSPPNPVQLSYHWLDEEGKTSVYEGVRTPLVEPVPAGHRRTIDLSVAAPQRTGRHLLRVCAVQELERWFDEPGPEREAWIEVIERQGADSTAV